MRLEGKSVVVTGASSGMGNSIVQLFVNEGANVVAVARRKERLEELALSLKDAPGKIVTFVGDVSKQEDNEKMIDVAVAEFGKLDILINNAGIMDSMEPIGEFVDEKLDSIFKTNVYGPMYAMRKAVNVFQAQGNGGNIINISSIGSCRTAAGAVYCASKAAITSLTKNTAFMYMPDGIRCNAIAPGGIATEIGTSMGVPNENGLKRIQTVTASSPASFGTGDNIAYTALFLASDESCYTSGDVIWVDGGWNAG